MCDLSIDLSSKGTYDDYVGFGHTALACYIHPLFCTIYLLFCFLGEIILFPSNAAHSRNLVCVNAVSRVVIFMWRLCFIPSSWVTQPCRRLILLWSCIRLMVRISLHVEPVALV